MITIKETNFPDKNFRDWLLKQDYGKDGVLTEKAINSITLIDVNYQDISTLKGIEHFTALTTLLCSGNQLTTLDLSNNKALMQATCCFNQLTTLNISNCTKLTWLDCSNNHLTNLDVSGHKTLATLICSANQLTTIDVSECLMLISLRCNLNQIKEAAMDKLIDGLPQKERGWFFVCGNTNSAEGNVCTKAQAAAAKAKGWTTYRSIFSTAVALYADSDDIQPNLPKRKQ